MEVSLLPFSPLLAFLTCTPNCSSGRVRNHQLRSLKHLDREIKEGKVGKKMHVTVIHSKERPPPPSHQRGLPFVLVPSWLRELALDFSLHFPSREPLLPSQVIRGGILPPNDNTPRAIQAKGCPNIAKLRSMAAINLYAHFLRTVTLSLAALPFYLCGLERHWQSWH